MPKTAKDDSKINIDFIESHLSEELLLAAEELYDKEPIIKSIQPQTNNWEITVDDQSMRYTVTIKITEGKLIESTCNCVKSNATALCAHAVVGIFHIRKEARKKEAQKTRKKRVRLNMKSIVHKTSADDLRSFVQEYAKRNRSFKLILQARFIDNIDEAELPHFFESIYPIHTKVDQKVSTSNLSVFVSVMDELKEHFRNLILHQEFVQAYNQIHHALIKSFYIKHHMTSTHKGFEATHEMLIQYFIECHRLIEAPEYRDHMLSQMSELLQTSFVDASTTAEQQLWLEAFRIEKDHNILKSNLKTLLKRNNISAIARYFLSMLGLLMEKENNWPEAIKSKDSQEIFRIAQLLIEYKHLPKATGILHALMIHKNLNNTVAKSILNGLSSSPNITFSKRVIDYLLLHKKNHYLTWLHDKSGHWLRIQDAILKKLSADGNLDLLINYHLTNSDPKSATEIIRTQDGWDLLLTYDVQIEEQSQEICFQLYTDKLIEYLGEHFGFVANQQLNKMLGRVSFIGGGDWVKKIQKQIQIKFPNRNF